MCPKVLGTLRAPSLLQSAEWGQAGPRKGLKESKALIALDTAPLAAGEVQVIPSLSQPSAAGWAALVPCSCEI